MEVIKFSLNKQKISLIDCPIIASNSKDYLYASFELESDDWVKPIIAIFISEEKVPFSVTLDDNNMCKVPWEVLQYGNKVEVSAVCGDLHTATSVTFNYENSGYRNGNEPLEPSPTIWSELLKKIEAKQDKIIAGDGSGGTSNYKYLNNKPSINGVELNGNKSLEDLNIKQVYTADDISFADGETFQQKFNNGKLKGQDGKDGTNGQNGADGKDGNTPFIGENGNWWIGTTDTGVKATGVDGEKGEKGDTGEKGQNGLNGNDGIGIKEAFISNTGELILTYSDNTTANLGIVKGKDGLNGINGEKGEKGEGYTLTEDDKKDISAEVASLLFESGTTESSALYWENQDQKKCTMKYRLDGEFCTLTGTADLIEGWSIVYYKLPVPAIAEAQILLSGSTTFEIKTSSENNFSVLSIEDSAFNGSSPLLPSGQISFTFIYRYK